MPTEINRKAAPTIHPKRHARRIRRWVLALLVAGLLLPVAARIIVNTWAARWITHAVEAVTAMELEVDRLDYHRLVGRATVHLAEGMRVEVTRAALSYRPWLLARREIDLLHASCSLHRNNALHPIEVTVDATHLHWNKGVHANITLHTSGQILTATIRPSGNGYIIDADAPAFTAALNEILDGAGHLADGQLSAHATVTPERLTGEAAAHLDQLEIGPLKTRSLDVAVRLPAVAAAEQPMELRLTCRDAEVGPLRSSAIDWLGRVTTNGVSLDGLVPLNAGAVDAQVSLRGQWHPTPQWRGTVEMPIHDANNGPLPLERLAAQAKGVTAQGMLRATFAGNAQALDTLQAEWDLSHLGIPEKGFSLTNLRGRCNLDPRNPARSLPGQSVRADTLSMGALAFSEVRLRYQLEAGPALLIEDIDGIWCGGHISASGIRIAPGIDNIEARLQCDRLDLRPLLLQCGARNVDGSGEFNGQLLVQWRDRTLTIPHGFLFTTPGSQGRVAFPDSAELINYLPLDPRIRAQADMVGAALADYNYDWITLTLETVDGDLMIRSSFAGRPARPIPFAHNRSTGIFERLPPGARGGIQDPMQIDLNFRVPLDKLLRYGFGTAAGIRAMGRTTGKETP